jgi:hypothetical protein
MPRAEWRSPAVDEDLRSLDARAIALLKKLEKENCDAVFVFPGDDESKSLSNAALLSLLKRITMKNVTPHGHTAFGRRFGIGQLSEPTTLVKLQKWPLGHVVRDKAEAAYVAAICSRSDVA